MVPRCRRCCQEFRAQRNLATYSRSDFRSWLSDKKCREQRLGSGTAMGRVGRVGRARAWRRTVPLVVWVGVLGDDVGGKG